MIETEALFITLDFHTRHDSRLFHLRAFICRIEEWVPIFKLTLPYFLLYKWPSMLFFMSFTLNWPFSWLSLSLDVVSVMENVRSCHFVPHVVHLHSVWAQSCVIVVFVAMTNREAGLMWKNVRGWIKRGKKSVSPRLWKEELYRGMLNGLKVEVTAFQSVSLETDQRLGPGFWSSTLQEAVFYVGRVVKIKNWTVCGQRLEGGEVGESVSCGLREDAVCFHPLLSTCCSQKTFHPLSWPEAAFPLRPDRLGDLLQVLECLKFISRTHWEISAAETEI